MVFDLEFYDNVNTAKKMAQAIDRANRKKRASSLIKEKQRQQKKKTAAKKAKAAAASSTGSSAPTSPRRARIFFSRNSKSSDKGDPNSQSLETLPEQGTQDSFDRPEQKENNQPSSGKKKDGKATSDPEEGSASHDSGTNLDHEQQSLVSQSTSYSNAPPGTFRFHHSVEVDKCWEQVKKQKNYSTRVTCLVAERLRELDDSGAARDLVTSPSDMAFANLCETVIMVIDFIVSFVGPDMEDFQDELWEIGSLSEQAGINVALLGEAVSFAIQQVCHDTDAALTEEQVEAWKIVMDHVACHMITPN